MVRWLGFIIYMEEQREGISHEVVSKTVIAYIVF